MSDVSQYLASDPQTGDSLNEVPTDRVALIDRNIASLRQALHELDRTRTHIESQLFALHKDRQFALYEVAPVRRLPPEILSRIFEIGSLSSPAAADFQVAVCSVCTHWRAVAITSPSMWSQIDIAARRDRDIEFLEWTKLCLQRSQASSFALNLNFSRYSSDTEPLELVERSMEIVDPHLPRCYSLKIRVRSQELLAQILEKCNGVSHSLVELAIASSTESGVDFFEIPPPKLRSLSFNGVRIFSWKPPMFTTLQELFLKSIPWIPFHSFLYAIQHSPLRELRIESCTFLFNTATFVDIDPTTISIPSLNTVEFNLMKSTDISLFLETVLSPSLVHLGIRFEYDQDLSWFPREPTSAHEIKTLELHGCITSGSAISPIIRMLRQLSNLKELLISNCDVTSQFFAALGTPRATRPCPGLESLTVKTCSEITGYELLEFIRARNADARVSKLRVLSILSCATFGVEILDLLNQHVDRINYQRFS